MESSWQAWLTFGIALLGAVLGVMNTWHSLRRDKVRLRVRPLSVAHPIKHYDFGIEVVNLSLFAVTVEEIGFTLNGRSAEGRERAVILAPDPTDGEPFPRRLEPRSSVTLYFDSQYASGASIGRAYARTACWEFAYGTSPALKSLRGR
jgi:hypothetical protein